MMDLVQVGKLVFCLSAAPQLTLSKDFTLSRHLIKNKIKNGAFRTDKVFKRMKETTYLLLFFSGRQKHLKLDKSDINSGNMSHFIQYCRPEYDSSSSPVASASLFWDGYVEMTRSASLETRWMAD